MEIYCGKMLAKITKKCVEKDCSDHNLPNLEKTCFSSAQKEMCQGKKMGHGKNCQCNVLLNQ